MFDRIKQFLNRPGMQERGQLLRGAGEAMQGRGLGGMLGALKNFRNWKGSQGGPQLQPGGAWQQRQPGFPGVGGTQSPMGGRGAGFSRQPRPFNQGLDQDFQAPQLASPAPPAPPAPVDFAPPKMQRAPAAGGAGPYGGFMGGQDIKQARPKPAQQDGFFGGFGRGYFG